MLLNRLGDSELTSHLLVNEERMNEWHDFKTEVINITRARAAAAGAYSLAGKNTLNSGIQPKDAYTVSRGTGKGQGRESRTLLVEQRQENRRQRDGQERQGQMHGQREPRAKDLEVPRVYVGLRTVSTVGMVEKPGQHARDCRSIAILGEGETGEADWGARNNETNINLNLNWKHGLRSVAVDFWCSSERVEPSLAHSNVWS